MGTLVHGRKALRQLVQNFKQKCELQTKRTETAPDLLSGASTVSLLYFPGSLWYETRLFFTALQFGKPEIKALEDRVWWEVLYFPAVSPDRGNRGDNFCLHRAGDMEEQGEGTDPLTLARMLIPLERTFIS